MNENDHIQKLITDVKNGEKGWRKVLATAEGSFSRKLAQENLLRLDALHETLLLQLNALNTTPIPQRPTLRAAFQDGTLGDDLSGSLA